MVAGFVAVVVWLLGFQGVGAGSRQLLYSPGLLLLVFGLMIVSASFHEFGHAAACRYSGGRPGGMGCGLYLVWPAFYTDVTDAYRLDRRGRLRTDLGGLYFNAIFALAMFAVPAVAGVDACSCSSRSRCSRCCTSSCPSCGSTATTSSLTWSGCPTSRPDQARLLALVPGRRTSEKAARP